MGFVQPRVLVVDDSSLTRRWLSAELGKMGLLVDGAASVEEALSIVARESGIDAPRISSVVRQGGIYHEILEEAAAVHADLIVMTSHRPAMRTYFLGSNAGHVVRYAKCSVLVVRH